MVSFSLSDNLEHFDTADRAKSIPFDERFLNRIQFSSLLISFIGLDRNEMVVSALIDYFRSHYKETNEEASEKRNLVRRTRDVLLSLDLIETSPLY